MNATQLKFRGNEVYIARQTDHASKSLGTAIVIMEMGSYDMNRGYSGKTSQALQQKFWRVGRVWAEGRGGGKGGVTGTCRAAASALAPRAER